MTDKADRELELLASGRHGDPHRLLGRHGGVVRTLRPDASSVWLLVPGATPTNPVPMTRVPMTRVHRAGIWEAPIDPAAPSYRLEADSADGSPMVFDDPYRAWPTLGDVDLHLIGEGRHLRLWDVLGAHPRVHEGMAGVAFAVWAPNARAVRVVGDWNGWDGRVHPMRSLGGSGVWELFIPGISAGPCYKFEIVGADGRLVLKADPMAFQTEAPPSTASVIAPPPAHVWGDEAWLRERAQHDLQRRPMSVYEVHLGSWRRGPGGRPLTYRELAEQLPGYAADLGFTHVELMPVAEHPFAGSWGYQVSAYYAPTARFGTPDEFRALVDACHQHGLGVIVDWVPAHFPRDDFALARFDGTALYEHADPRRGEHPDWGTLVFNYGRNEVRNFLVANALYWMEAFHIDALRVDAVASMLYLDYSRPAGAWVPNEYGGRENLEGVAFLKEVNETVFARHPGVTMIAEESTAWPAVSRPTWLGGLGFGFKWNMGWMHDTLDFFSVDPLYRRYHHRDLTFGLLYAWSEHFILPLSHDEVVHEKRSLLAKMPGDAWQQLANLRALYGWMWAHPGKQLVFMGGELGQEREWDHDGELDWGVLDRADHRRLQSLLRELNRLYATLPPLWEADDAPDSFRWIDAGDEEHSVLSFLRLSSTLPPVACVANLTPVPHVGYRIGLPSGGWWAELLNTDAAEWGGSGVGNSGGVQAVAEPWHGLPWSAEFTLPPLGVLWLSPR